MNTIAGVLQILIFTGLLIIAVVSWFIWDKRYRKNHGTDIPSGYDPTDEIFLDPVTGKQLKVYFNPKTGERFYHEKKS